MSDGWKINPRIEATFTMLEPIDLNAFEEKASGSWTCAGCWTRAYTTGPAVRATHEQPGSVKVERPPPCACGIAAWFCTRITIPEGLFDPNWEPRGGSFTLGFA